MLLSQILPSRKDNSDDCINVNISSTTKGTNECKPIRKYSDDSPNSSFKNSDKDNKKPPIFYIKDCINTDYYHTIQSQMINKEAVLTLMYKMSKRKKLCNQNNRLCFKSDNSLIH